MNTITIIQDANVQEEKNRIASALKMQYKDFISSLDMPMTEELFLNYRDTIADVFKILKKNGIDVASR